MTTRPHIYYCRSPDMNVFTCWWHPLDNLTAGEQVSYVLTYSNECVSRSHTHTLDCKSSISGFSGRWGGQRGIKESLRLGAANAQNGCEASLCRILTKV